MVDLVSHLLGFVAVLLLVVGWVGRWRFGYRFIMRTGIHSSASSFAAIGATAIVLGLLVIATMVVGFEEVESLERISERPSIMVVEARLVAIAT